MRYFKICGYGAGRMHGGICKSRSLAGLTDSIRNRDLSDTNHTLHEGFERLRSQPRYKVSSCDKLKKT